MADNIMGGYSSSDITANIDVNLNNIDRSTQDAATLAAQLQDWGSSIEAAKNELKDFNSIQEESLNYANELADAHERILRSARELKELATSSTVDFRDLATNAREVQRALSGLGGGGIGGGEMGGAPYTPGVSSATPASVIENGMGMPGTSPDGSEYSMGDSSSFVNDVIDAASMGAGSGWKGRRGGSKTTKGRTGPGMPVTQASTPDYSGYGEDMAKRMLGINYWMPGGKAAALGRYLDKLSGGGVTKWLSNRVQAHPRIFGTPGIPEQVDEEAFQRMMLLGGYPGASGMGATLEEARAQAALPGADPALLSALSDAEEAAVTPAVAGTTGLLGAIGAIAMPLAIAGGIGYLGMQGYNAYASYAQQGQLMSSLTGQGGVAGANRMLGMEANDFFMSMFNPLMNYGTAKQIQMTGLGAGFLGSEGVFGGGSGLLGQYTNFASGAYQNYGMSPQDSLQMFNASVIAAGATVNQLNNSLGSLAQTSSHIGASFQQLQQNFTSSVAYLGGLGVTGQAAVNLAEGMAKANAGTSTADTYLRQQNIGGTGMLMQTMPGIALTAQAAGISFTQAFAQMGTQAGAAQLFGATNKAILNIIKNSTGIYPNMPGLSTAVNNNLFQLYSILSSLMPEGPDGKGAEWTPEATRDWVMKAMSAGGGGESISAAQAGSVTALVNQLSGGVGGQAGITNSINSIASKIMSTGNYAGGQVMVNGQWENLSSIGNLSLAQQKSIMTGLLSGNDLVRGANARGVGTGSGETLAQLYSNTTLQQMNSNPVATQASMQIELGPRAKALFELINNPQKLSSQQIQYLSQLGLSSNTNQSTGWQGY
jgi:hypothetical protein